MPNCECQTILPPYFHRFCHGGFLALCAIFRWHRKGPITVVAAAVRAHQAEIGTFFLGYVRTKFVRGIEERRRWGRE